ncbi:phenylalanine--tRNA ligase subunit alpha [Candidatus Hepatoplasma crinochetorum]|uniref:phenylalanine--tRNA ligase subunit alpha n=1 Tax=Candidatus Hepatoplasma crinochetorum TaxID=295596 RepID=UPI0030893AA0|nr:MAG: phenylalanine--tRNA ligase alpha subunit [Candidatus Hepatoplasma crinochetorum]
MNNEIEKIFLLLKKELKETENLESWKQIKAKYLTKSLFFNNLKNNLKNSKDSEEKIKIGKLIQFYLLNINQILNNKRKDLENNFFASYQKNPLLEKEISDIIITKKIRGNIHPLTKITLMINKYFDNLNFNYVYGNEIEIEKFNFDYLNIPKDHPAREMQDTFYLENENKLLRTHTTNITARKLLLDKSNLLKYYTIGIVYRNDDNDATHSIQFNQLDFFMLSKSTSLANFKYILINLLETIFDKNIPIRFRPSYFPFTEPSFEVDVGCFKCKQNGCEICKNSGWIEILGSGMISHHVLKLVGKNDSNMQGFAAGIGIERLAMLRFNIKDIRNFYLNNLSFLRNYDKGDK